MCNTGTTTHQPAQCRETRIPESTRGAYNKEKPRRVEFPWAAGCTKVFATQAVFAILPVAPFTRQTPGWHRDCSRGYPFDRNLHLSHTACRNNNNCHPLSFLCNICVAGATQHWATRKYTKSTNARYWYMFESLLYSRKAKLEKSPSKFSRSELDLGLCTYNVCRSSIVSDDVSLQYCRTTPSLMQRGCAPLQLP